MIDLYVSHQRLNSSYVWSLIANCTVGVAAFRRRYVPMRISFGFSFGLTVLFKSMWYLESKRVHDRLVCVIEVFQGATVLLYVLICNQLIQLTPST
jgi:hypothetical protein